MVSIIVPVYNPGTQFSTLLDCIRYQTEQDIEVLLIDDGCEDGSAQKCDEYSRIDQRFRVFHQNNSGVSEARRLGLASAKGDFVAFIDADDEIPMDYIEVLLKTQRQSLADVVVCDVAMLENGKVIGRFTHSPSVIDADTALNLLLSRVKINSGPCAKLFRSEALRRFTFPPLKVYEDILFVRDVFASAGKIAITDQTEYRYLQNQGSATDKNRKKPSLDVVVATDNLAMFLRSHQELDPYCFYITISHMMQYVIPLARLKDDDSLQFTKAARILLKKFQGDVVRCSAFPWREKILFILYAYSGILLCD